jgi:hypothetical protein
MNRKEVEMQKSFQMLIMLSLVIASQTATAAFTVTFPRPPGSYRQVQEYNLPNGNHGIATVVPALPMSIKRGGTEDFLAELNREFGATGTVNRGWNFVTGGELTNSSFRVTQYEAVGTPTEVGANFSLAYDRGGADPMQNPAPIGAGTTELHWIQRVRDDHNITNNPGHGNSENIIDIAAGGSVPFYDVGLPPVPRAPDFSDSTRRPDPAMRLDSAESHDWFAELYLASHIHGAAEKTLTIYNGVEWGWINRVGPGKVQDGGGGRADPLGPVPSAMNFSPAIFEPGTFNYFKEIQLGDTTVNLELVNFKGLIEFDPTTNPDIFAAHFSQLEFDYQPFDLSGITGVSKEVLDTSSTSSGWLDNGTGDLFLNIPTHWLTTSGDLVATSFEAFHIGLKPFSPTLVDMTFNSTGVLTPIPEPSRFLLLSFGIVVLFAYSKRKIRE